MLKERLQNIYIYRQTLWNMAVKQLKVKYAGSILGISWAILNPLLIMSAIAFVFTAILKIEIKNFPLFALSGILPWFFFSSALTEATPSFLSQQNILHQFNLPREIIPLAAVLSNFLNFLIGWVIILPIFLFFNPKIILLSHFFIIILLLTLFFVSGLSLVLSVANIFFRDINQLLGVFLMFWFWITPVFYSTDMVPLRFSWVCSFNPVAHYIVFYRQVLFEGNSPGFRAVITVFFWALISLISGFMIFSRLETKLLKRI